MNPEDICGRCGHAYRVHYNREEPTLFGGSQTAQGCGEFDCRCAGFVLEAA